MQYSFKACFFLTLVVTKNTMLLLQYLLFFDRKRGKFFTESHNAWMGVPSLD
jgi:hypothetical protein